MDLPAWNPGRILRPATAGAAAAVLLLAGCSPATAGDGTPSATSTTPPATTPPTTTTPAAAPLPADVRAALDALVAAGAVGAVADVRDGDRVSSGAAGIADRTSGAPATVDAPVRIASTTKAVVATVVVQLAEEGRFGLDDPVDAVLPGVLPPERGVTVRQLLDHTSGLPSSSALDGSTAQELTAAVAHRWSDEELVADALRRPWTAAPGTRFSYSNENYVVLGMLVRHVTGQDLPEVLRDRVFGPAGMTATEFPTTTAMPGDALRGYLFTGPDPAGGAVDTTVQEPSVWSAGAALVSTAGDVSRFFRALFSHRLVSPAGVAAMQEIGVEGYGLGLLAGGDACGAVPPELVFGQRGNGIGYRSISLSSPDGRRQTTLVWTGTATDPAADPLERPMNAVLVAGLASTCP
ncbi:serine hydrolase domain-containing protein [Kineococcus rubinsiae]|uniref:serine hydrolase domain-containing protein n=1 Tax=Kineococcus rubinsiae TaxID=2609562 RepID=UPI0014311B7A|nr:serine hydrolase domain-containing protein [Kineococcus rubinsiae]NIZ91877.1 beta-lactamase family protein [Kineococcus rubinsiae]